MNEEKYIIRTESLSFTYRDGDETVNNDAQALSDVSLNVKEGEYIAGINLQFNFNDSLLCDS